MRLTIMCGMIHIYSKYIWTDFLKDVCINKQKKTCYCTINGDNMRNGLKKWIFYLKIEKIPLHHLI